MSALPEPAMADAGSATHRQVGSSMAPRVEQTTERGGLRSALVQLPGLLASDAPARLPVPSLALALVAFGVYAVLVSVTVFQVAIGLASIPLFVAAALLPARSALLMAVATVAVTVLPPVADHTWDPADSAVVAELTILVVASLAIRAAVARLVVSGVSRAREDALLSARIATVLDIAERLTKTFDRREIFQTIVEETNRALVSDATTIRILNDDQLEIAAWAGLPDEIASRLPAIRADEGWFADVLATGRPWVCDDVRATEGLSAAYAQHAGHQFASDLVVPLIHHDRVIGAISSVTNQPRHWTPRDVDFVTALATHASIAINNAELFDRTQVWAGQLGVLQAASARMNRQNTVESVGRAIVEETGRIIDYHNCRVYLLEPPDDLVPIAFEGRVGAYEKVDFDLLRTKVGKGFTGWVAEHGQPLLIHDANADPRGSTIPGTDDVDESMLIVPMSYDARVIGAITVSKLGLHQFEEEQLRLLTILADQAATAVESARLLARTQGLAGELRRLLDMGSALSDSLEPRKVADLIAQHIAGAMGVDQCAISHWDKPGDRILTWGYFPTARPDIVEPEYPLAGFPATRRVLEQQVTEVVEVDDPSADPHEVALLRREGNQFLAMLPLVAKGESIGLVEIISSKPVRLVPGDLELARTMANEAAMALENAKLYEEARNLADRDQLTGFYNHRFLHERLGEEIVRSQRSRSPLSLLMIDLDDFKLVNDTFGHLFGDRVLVWSSELIRSSLRASDMPARYGGDEFAVILPDTDTEAAHAAATRILQAFRDRAYESEARGAVPIAASIGVATFPHAARTAQELIAAADAALYRVKDAGGHGAALTGAEIHDHDGQVRSIARAKAKRRGVRARLSRPRTWTDPTPEADPARD